MRILQRMGFLVLYFVTFACFAQLPDARSMNGIRFITCLLYTSDAADE